MKQIALTLSAAALLLLPTTVVHSQGGPRNANFNAPSISGFPSGAVFLTGGGAFDPSTGFAKLSGAFRVLSDINQGPLAGARTGEGVRWDTDALLPSTTFKCTGAPSEVLKTATTDANTVVLRADFYRQGDGVNESFKAAIIISSVDLDPVLPGVQNVWVQGVGCGEANVNVR